MKRQKVLRLLRAHQAELSQRGITSLSIFGSVARDQAEKNSDVDILVDFSGPPTFDGYMEAKFYLEDILGTRVDLVTRQALKPHMRPIVEQEAVRVA
jgi:hypothetical protein